MHKSSEPPLRYSTKDFLPLKDLAGVGLTGLIRTLPIGL